MHRGSSAAVVFRGSVDQLLEIANEGCQIHFVVQNEGQCVDFGLGVA